MKGLRHIGLTLAAVMVGVLAISILRSPSEPRYQGRTLSTWIEEGKITYYFDMDGFWPAAFDRVESDPNWQITSHAVKQMAPEAIPFLLKWAQATDSAPRKKLIAWLDRHPSLHWKITPAQDRNLSAILGFGFLGKEASPVWPGLIRCAYDTNCAWRGGALLCLVASHPGNETLLPVLRHLTNDANQRVQGIATRVLSEQVPGGTQNQAAPGQ